MRDRARMLAMAAMMVLGPAPVWACPLCKSETGERVRAGIFNADFGYNLVVTLLPFAVFLTIVATIHHGLPWAKDRPLAVMSPDPGDADHS